MTGVVSWWWAIPFFIAISLPLAMGVVVYHRVLTHKAARLSPWVEYPLVAIAAPAGTPVGWVGNHRHHHQVTDQFADPHAPGQHGFWVAQAGWYLGTTSTPLSVLYAASGTFRFVFDAFWRPRTGMTHARLAKDINQVPFYRWLSRPGPYAFVVLSQVVITLALTLWLFGVWALPILYLIPVGLFALGDGVNSLSHRFGNRPFRTRDESTNLAWLAALTLGEGFHHNHHVFPTSVRTDLIPGQIDPFYQFCRLLERVGLAANLRQPRYDLMLDRVVDPDARRKLEARGPRASDGTGRRLVADPQTESETAPDQQATLAGAGVAGKVDQFV